MLRLLRITMELSMYRLPAGAVVAMDCTVEVEGRLRLTMKGPMS